MKYAIIGAGGTGGSLGFSDEGRKRCNPHRQRKTP